MLRLAWIILAVLASLAAGAVVHSSTASTSPSKDAIDCKDREDGFYVVGCSKNFTECHHGTAHKKNCPAHLYFHSRLGRCETASEIPECRNPKAVEGKILQSPPEFSCVDKPDGFYTHPANPCDKSYYVCLKDNVMRMACGYQQFFDIKSQRCEFKSRVPACKGIKIAGSEYPQSNPYGQLPRAQDGPMPPAPPSGEADGVTLSSSDSPPDCSTQEDGVFPDQKSKCTTFFFKCAHKKLFKYTCQKGLFFDTEAIRCDHKQYVPNCGGVRQATTAAPALDSAVIDFDCSGKSDGYHEKEPCAPEFYTCLAGVAMRQTCNSGLLYDSRVGYCDYPMACNGERTTTPRPPPAEVVNALQSDSAKPRARPAPVDFDCQKHGDGNHQLGKCQKDYVMCTNGQAKQHTCPADLVFNGQQCDYLGGCLNPPSTTVQTPQQDQSSPQMPANPYGSQQNQPAAPTPAALPPSPPPATLPPRDQPSSPGVQFNCTGLPNGSHALEECSESYVDCWTGIAYPRSCPSGLHFNPVAGYCDYPGSANGCGGNVPKIATPATPTQAPIFQSQPFQRNNGYGQPQQPAQSPPQPKATPAPENRKCSGLSNGKYAEGCSNVFYNCVYGQTYKTECPEGLFYSIEKDRCDVRSAIPACGGQLPEEPAQPQQPQQPQQTPPQQPAYGQSTRRLSSNSVIPGAEATPIYGQGAMASDAVNQIGTECTDESVTNEGCNPHYFRCLNGRLDRVFCAPGLYYDLPSHSCTQRNKIIACGGSPAISNDVSATQAPINLPPPSGADTFCAGKDTGFFGVGCNTYGYACVSGATLKFNCPSGTYFSTETNKCEWKEHIAACGGTSPVSTTPAPKTQAAMLPVIEGVNAADAPQLPPFCEKLADGYYGDGCNAHYYYCRSKQTTKMTCPRGLFYNIQKKRCQLKDAVPACSPQTIAQNPPAPTAAPTAWSPYNQLASPAPARSTWMADSTQSAPPAPPPVEDDFDCSDKEDGLYNLPDCSPLFIQCYSKQKIQNKCQDGLFYNPANGMCDWAERIEACGGSLPTTTAAPSTPRPAASDAARPTIAPYPASVHQVQADTPMDASCAGKADGYYGDGCSEKYYSCISGTLHQHKCQAMLKFNEADAICDYELNVPACQSSSSAAADVPSGPAVPSTTAAPKIESLPTFSCRGKSDGDYRLFPCSRNYIKCIGGRYQLQACQGDLKFDGNSKRCDIQSRNDACPKLPENKDQQTSPAPPVRSSWTPTQTVAPAPAQGSAAPPAPPPSFQQDQPQTTQSSSSSVSGDFCQGKEDGFYASEDCSSIYVSCVAQAAYRGVCPEQLVFDGATGFCDYPTKCGSASGSSQPTSSSGVQQSPPAQSTWGQQQQNYGQQQPQASQPSQPLQPTQSNQLPARPQNYNQQQPSQTQPQMPEFSCNGQADGIYGAKCMSNYFKCSGGVTFQQTCTQGSVFDGVTGGCDFPAKVGCQQ